MRGNGIASKVLSDLHEDSFVVLECWYRLPSLKLYQKLGFTELYLEIKKKEGGVL